MKKKLLCILQCMFVVVLFSGCWSSKEPKSLSMVNSILYDINDDGVNQITVEIMNSTAQAGSKGMGDEKNPSLVYLSEGTTMPEAVRDETKSIDKILFGGLNKARLFSEKLSQSGIGPILDYFMRDHLTDETPLMVVVQDEDPKRIYTCSTGFSDMVGNYLDSLSDTQHKSTCESVFITTLTFIKDYYLDGKQPVMGLVKIEKSKAEQSNTAQSGSQGSQGSQGTQSNSGKNNIRYEGLAAFKDDKLVGYMNAVETRAYNMITNDFGITAISIPSGPDFTVAKMNEVKSEIKTNVQEEQMEINVNIKVALSILQAGGSIDISKSEALKIVEQKFNKQLESEITKAVEKAQREFKSDIFGFGCYVHIQHPQKWKEIKGNWDDLFSQANVNITVESSIIREGEIKHPFLNEE